MPPKRNSRRAAAAGTANPAPPRVRPGILPRHRGRAYFTDELLPYDPDQTRYIYRNFGRYREAEWRAEEAASAHQRDAMADMLAVVGFDATIAEGLHHLNALPVRARSVPSRARAVRLAVPAVAPVALVAAEEDEEEDEVVEEAVEEPEAEEAEEEAEEAQEAEEEEGKDEEEEDDEEEDAAAAGPSTSKKFFPSEQNRDYKTNPVALGVPEPALFAIRGHIKGVQTTKTYAGAANFDWNNKKSVTTLLQWRNQIYRRSGAPKRNARFFSTAETQWLENYWAQVLRDVRSDPAARLPPQTDIVAAFNAAFPAAQRSQASISSNFNRAGSRSRRLKEEAEGVIRGRQGR
ncbi:uncharacterized protein BDZ99DRAFT_518066 [Mytilinidion resinicola]|uniref:Uncharacterized protein n=1 Tax=Mytilinidion resinicola TaxID=574789 RepID=A0A6A6YTV6_9PEZI|nr:uncharacterized protein BDZ99DRAFT_518066 [Mytilinidion resinicola]KAF2812211.1 hypothetical protein BDZ99DRAFT_518066 [Mytilinidion resinicola]